MKKYFVSYVKERKGSFTFHSRIRTSMKKNLEYSDIAKWEHEFKSRDFLSNITILNFQELKG